MDIFGGASFAEAVALRDNEPDQLVVFDRLGENPMNPINLFVELHPMAWTVLCKAIVELEKKNKIELMAGGSYRCCNE